jgi:hypothetical protein
MTKGDQVIAEDRRLQVRLISQAKGSIKRPDDNTYGNVTIGEWLLYRSTNQFRICVLLSRLLV